METPRVMTVMELADYLHVHPSIYRLLKQRELPAFKLGRDWRFNRETIEQWLKKRENEIQ